MRERKHYCPGLKFGLVSNNFLHTTIPIAILFQNTASTLTAQTLANEIQACRYLARFCFSSAHGSRTLYFLIPRHLPFWLRTNLSCHRKVTKGLPLSTQKLDTRKLGQNSNITQKKTTQRKHFSFWRSVYYPNFGNVITFLLSFIQKNWQMCNYDSKNLMCTIGMYWIWAFSRKSKGERDFV